MKLIKLTEDHYVVVDDSEIKDGDWYISPSGGIISDHNGTEVLPDGWNKITHSTQPLEYTNEDHLHWDKIKRISLSEVKELIGEVDVEKKAEKFIGCEYEDIEDNIDQIGYDSFIRAYNQALEDNKDKKYTEEDMRKAFEAGNKRGWSGYPNTDNWTQPNLEDYIQSLQPKTQWEYIGECKGNNGNGCFMDSPGHDCGCYKRVPKTQWGVEWVDGKLKLILI